MGQEDGGLREGPLQSCRGATQHLFTREKKGTSSSGQTRPHARECGLARATGATLEMPLLPLSG